MAHYDSVLVTTRTIGPSDAISRDDVDVVWRETTRFRGTPLSAAVFQQDAPLRADRHLQSGRMLRENDVRPPYAVDTGQTVTVQYQRGRLRMTLRCKAREPGFVGDVIRVYAPDNDTVITSPAWRARASAYMDWACTAGGAMRKVASARRVPAAGRRRAGRCSIMITESFE